MKIERFNYLFKKIVSRIESSLTWLWSHKNKILAIVVAVVGLTVDVPEFLLKVGLTSKQTITISPEEIENFSSKGLHQSIDVHNSSGKTIYDIWACIEPSDKSLRASDFHLSNSQNEVLKNDYITIQSDAIIGRGSESHNSHLLVIYIPALGPLETRSFLLSNSGNERSKPCNAEVEILAYNENKSSMTKTNHSISLVLENMPPELGRLRLSLIVKGNVVGMESEILREFFKRGAISRVSTSGWRELIPERIKDLSVNILESDLSGPVDRAYANLVMGKTGNAIEEFSALSGAFPMDFTYTFGLALCHVSYKNYQRAIDIIEDSKSVKDSLDSRIDALITIGSIREAQKDFWAAEKLYEEIDHSTTNNWIVKSKLCAVKLYLSKTGEADLYCNAAVKLNPKDAASHNSLGALYALTGNYDSAVVKFKDALIYDPDAVSAINNLIEIFHAKGDTNNAKYYKKLKTESIKRLRH